MFVRPARWSWVNLGSLGAAAILLLWLWLSAYPVVLGAEPNMQVEHRTAVDPAIGKPRPIGKRGASVADTLGRKP